jgi:hypothetical protein
MEKKEVRAPVACRILPDLRQQLEEEAAEVGQSLSSYMESVLLVRRKEATVNEKDTEALAAMLNQIAELQAENERLRALPPDVNVQMDIEDIEALKAQLAQSESQYQDLANRYKSLTAERNVPAQASTSVNSLPSWWSHENYRNTVPYLKELKSKHPDCSIEQLLLSAVAVAVTNENNWVHVYTLTDFWKRNPHFLNPETQIAQQ